MFQTTNQFKVLCGLQNTDLYMEACPSLMPGHEKTWDGNSETSATRGAESQLFGGEEASQTAQKNTP